MTRSQVQDWLDKGLVLAGGVPRAKNYKLRTGDTVEVRIPEAVSCEAAA